MTLVLVLLGLLALMALIGWARFERTEDRVILSIETRVIRENTGQAVVRGKQLLARFGGRHSSHSADSHEETRASEAGPGPSAAGHHP
jgi:hypothetical protein